MIKKEKKLKKVVVLFADGCEETEALTPVDYLRRAGTDAVCAGVNGLRITSSHKIVMEADVLLKELKPSDFDAVIVPGGMPGSVHIAESSQACAFINAVFTQGGIVASLCAAPAVVLARLGILKNRTYTCYPEMEKDIPQYAGSSWQQLTEGCVHSTERVVIDGTLVTSRAPGCAEEFSLALIRLLCGAEKEEHIRRTICAR